jgi:hypothetical protein
LHPRVPQFPKSEIDTRSSALAGPDLAGQREL